jgi:hypothetical protein
MHEHLKEHGLNIAQIFILSILLIIPVNIAPSLINDFEIYQINQNIGIFIAVFVPLFMYFFATIYFIEKLISRLHDLVSLKYLVIIIFIFWVCYDLYLINIYQDIYFEFQGLITSRGIVWRDVEVLPLHVQYKDFLVAFYLANYCLQAATLITAAYKLMSPKADHSAIAKFRRKKTQSKSMDDIKATLHPSILKKYDKND